MSSPLQKYHVLNVPIAATTLSEASLGLINSAKAGAAGYACALSVHTVTIAHYSEKLEEALNNSILNVPDGRPLAWAGQLSGFKKAEQVRGPDLMLEICKLSAPLELRHFLYGGKPGVADKLKANLEAWFPGIQIVGVHCPPFRELIESEEEVLKERLQNLRPHFFWVGLGTPKQELFCARYSAKWNSGILISVGAAFDFHTGALSDSPPWVRRAGLQWLHRLIQEPARLWRRYLLLNPLFIFLVLKGYLLSAIKSRNRH